MSDGTSTGVRAARGDDYDAVRAIISRAFQSNDEAQLWDYLVAHDPDLQPEGVRVATVDGRPVACTVVLPRQVRGRYGWVSGAIITLVACDPDYQRQGHGSRSVRDARRYMTERDLGLGVLYGHRSYYPRFGFVPVLPGYLTILSADIGGESEMELATAQESDLPVLSDLYANQLGTYPCAVGRTAAAWQWRARHPDHVLLLMLSDHQGYALVNPRPEQGRLWVHEGAATDALAAGRMLAGLARQARAWKLAELGLAMPPDNIVVRMAVRQDAEQTYRPAAAGMALITDWGALLPSGYRVAEHGLMHEDQLVLQTNRRALTELIIGYRGIDDLVLAPDCVLLGDEANRARLQWDFPSAFPKWSLAPFWF